jgi:sigma-E factor negative regulatory protein RseB
MTQSIFIKQPPMILSLAALLLIVAFSSYSNTDSASAKNEQIIKAPSAQTQPQTSAVADSSSKPNEPDNTNDNLDSNDTETEFDVLSSQAWLRRLSNTVNQMSFEISFVVANAGRETMPYIWRHAILDEGGSAEQLSLLNGPGFEQIRINNKVSVFEPGFAPLSIRADVIDIPIPSAFIHQPEILIKAYDLLLMGRNRVSGRMAQQIRVISKDKSRYQYHLWLDEQTGLLLKLNMYDLKGVLLEQIQVTQLNISDDVKTHFTNIQANQLPPVTLTEVQQNQALPWTLGFIPEGMQIVTQNLRRISVTGQPAEYMMVSDGLVDVSVYVMKATDLAQEDVALTTEATSVVSFSDGRIQVTVVGEIPLETAQKMANSIVLVDERP